LETWKFIRNTSFKEETSFTVIYSDQVDPIYSKKLCVPNVLVVITPFNLWHSECYLIQHCKIILVNILNWRIKPQIILNKLKFWLDWAGF